MNRLPIGALNLSQTDASDVSLLDRIEFEAIIQALESCDWEQSKASQRLGVSPRVFNHKLNRWHLQAFVREKKVAWLEGLLPLRYLKVRRNA